MAEKDIMFTVGVNTGNTAQDMAQVDKSIEQVDKSVTGLNEETAKAQQSATNRQEIEVFEGPVAEELKGY